MINADMRLYDYSTIGEENAYGQAIMTESPVGQIKMAIHLTSQSIQDNINYKDANYVGLTRANVDDTYVIHYGEEKLKVLYINPKGRLTQVFMSAI